MAVKLTKESIKNLTKEELCDSIGKYIKDNIEMSIRKTREEDNFSLPSWSEYQAYQLGYQKALDKVLEYLPKP